MERPHIVNNDTPTPGALPTISERTKLRTNLGTAVAVFAAVIGFVWWLSAMWNNQTWIMQALRDLQADVREMKGGK